MKSCFECGSMFKPDGDEIVCPDCCPMLNTYIPPNVPERERGKFTEVKDSGQRREFATGSRRDVRTGKGRFDLLPAYVLMRDAKHMENGAVKYGERNWEKGQPLSVYLDSAFRHIVCFMDGLRDEDHLAAARWNIGGLIWTAEMIHRGQLPAELDDLPKAETYREVKGA